MLLAHLLLIWSSLLLSNLAQSTSVSVSCPNSNGTTYTASNGDQFVIECKFDRTGGDLSMKYTDNFQGCVDLCSSTPGCIDVSYSGTACYMKDKLKDGHSAGCSGARLISPSGDLPGSASTSSSTTSAPGSTHSSTSPATSSQSQPSPTSSKSPTSSPPSSYNTTSSSAYSSSPASPSNTTTPSSSGCSRPVPLSLHPGGDPQTFNLSLPSQPLRSYLLSLPPNYTPTTPAPLILSYHGHGGSPAGQASLSSFSSASLNPDAIVAYPAGIAASWQGAPYATPGVDDIAFTLALLDALHAALCVDPQRVYATGHSNGGGFVGMTLACDARGAAPFAAFAASSGAFYPNVSDAGSCDGATVPLLPCHPAAATTPFLEVHGTADGTIPYWGGPHGGECMSAVPRYVAKWADRDGWANAATQNESSVVAGAGTDKVTTRYTWDKEETVVHYRVEGLGHDWADNWGGFSTSPTMLAWLAGWKL
ncbi:MAG: hypothetical protein M1821_002304 [Bathelium mastoideum]|nr:MAG: hypothetical protein M1821_002304 [Bathelium mastoideum]